MTNSSNSSRDPEQNPRPRRRLARVLLLGGGIALIGATAAGWWAWRFINQQLAPLVSNELSKTFDRPVQVGAVQSVWLNQLTFGESTVPPTPTDSDRLTVEAVRVRFNLLELLWDRTLSLDVTLVRPNAYIAQDAEGLWITTQIQQGDGEEGPISIELDTLRVQAGTAQLAAYGEVESSQPVEPDPANPDDSPEADQANQSGQSAETGQSAEGQSAEPEDSPETLPRELAVNSIVGLQAINGEVTFRNDNKLIAYDITGRPETGGELRVEGTTNLDVQETVLGVTSRNLLASDISLLVPLPLQLQMGRLSTDLEVAFLPNDRPLQFDGTVRFRDVVARLEGAPKPFQQLNGALQFQGQRISFQSVEGRYGAIPARVSGSLDTQRGYDLRVQVPRATVPEILQTVDLEASDLPVPLEGTFQADLKLGGAIDKPLVTGTAQNLQPVRVDRLRFAQTQAIFAVTPQAVTINRLRAVPTAGGLILADGTIKLGDQSGLVVDVEARDLPGDTIAAAYGASSPNFSVGRVNATAQVFGPFNNVQTVVQWQAPTATYPGRGRVVIAGSDVRFEDTVVLAAGGIVRGNGLIRQGRWQASLDTSGIELSQFNPDLRGLLSGDFELAGSLDNFDPAAIEAAGRVRFSEGLAIITEPLEASVRWLGDRLQILEATAPGFRGDGFVLARLAGEGAPAIGGLDLNVELQDYRLTDLPVTIPEQIRVAGTTDFSGRVTGPLDAITVAGQLGLNNLAVNTLAFEPRLTGDFRYALNRGLSLDVAGQRDQIAVVLDDRNRPRSFYVRQAEAIARGQGNGDQLSASLANFPLTALNLTPGDNLGQVSGRLSGNFEANLADLSNPTVIGTVAIVDPALGFISADALPAAQAGSENCLLPPVFEATEVPPSDCAKSLFTGQFRYGDGVAVLEDGSQLRLGNSRYLLSGTFNPGSDPQFQGSVVADEGRIEDIFAALRWFELSDLGRLAPSDYGTEADVATSTVGLTNATLLNQLRRYSEIKALYRQQVIARQESSLLPELATLQGAFSGAVNLQYSAQAGPTVDFDLNGQNWQWGECVPPAIPEVVPQRCQIYQVEQVIARGEFANGVLQLLPVRLESGDSLFTFTGNVGGAQQSGQLIVENVPVAALRDLFDLPLDIEGDLDATATLGGSTANPQFEGELQLVNGTVNQTKSIPTVRSLFGYNNARLDFNTRFIAEAPPQNTTSVNVADPLATPAPPATPASGPTPAPTDDRFLFTGSIPYKLPFAEVEPDNYQLSLDLDIKNDGLSLINLFTDQVAWRGGEGDVQLEVRGNLPPGTLDFRTLTATGTASFTNAQIGASALPQDLTNVNGTVLFNRDRVEIPSLTGEFGNGQVTASGVIPLQYALRETDRDSTRPLVVGLDQLSIELADLYEGDVEGRVLITGAAFAPEIGGRITLSNGRIIVPTQEAAVATATTAAEPSSSPFAGGRGNGTFSPPQFDSLQVALGDRLRVTYDPVLNFLVRGDLIVTGTQADPLLDGVVNLRSGQVNLFTTQFNLAGGYRNTAVFDSARGLDPTLDVRLVTSVPEVTRYPNQTLSPFPVSEIVDTPSAGDFGALQTVRVQATVTGPASQIFNNLELTSSPSRSETEILALLGGGFIGNVQGNATTALASIAGSQLLTGLQNLINDTLGISDFRLFPTTIISQDARTTSLALAAELGVDITNDLSVSVLQLLTVQALPQVGLRYRLTDQLLLRGSTNFSDESRAVLEFETRF